jgi:small subunit ribosomal protein S13
MVYIQNTHLNDKKPIYQACTQIYGLGHHHCLQICDALGISPETRLGMLSAGQHSLLAQIITQNYDTGSDVRRFTRQNIQRLVHIHSFRGYRHIQGLPVRGQRTHGNARTVRKLKNTLKI